MSSQSRASAWTHISFVAILITAVLTQAQLQSSKTARYKEKVLYVFNSQSDGWLPNDLLVRDAQGNLYGATAFGGSLNDGCSRYVYDGCGVVFEISAAGKFSVLHTFEFSDGANPSIGVQDANGNLYGTAAWGGHTAACPDYGCGVIFKLTPAGVFTLLYSFTGGSDGANPNNLIMDDQGNFYGTTVPSNTGNGEVFELTNSGSLQVLHVFGQPPDGSIPLGVVRDSSGNLYGTTAFGGAYGPGTVFKLDPSGNETILYSFRGKSDGGAPFAPPVMDKAGNLYGTASQDGYEGKESGSNCDPPNSTEGCGTVFKVNSKGVFSVLFAFHYFNGDYPVSALTVNADGSIYGTTWSGGKGCAQGGGCGVAFAVMPRGKESVLYNFQGGASGSVPGNLIEDGTEHLYGTTAWGGDLSCPYNNGVGCGVVFELTP